jgi:hypothetical protein
MPNSKQHHVCKRSRQRDSIRQRHYCANQGRTAATSLVVNGMDGLVKLTLAPPFPARQCLKARLENIDQVEPTCRLGLCCHSEEYNRGGESVVDQRFRPLKNEVDVEEFGKKDGGRQDEAPHAGLLSSSRDWHRRHYYPKNRGKSNEL